MPDNVDRLRQEEEIQRSITRELQKQAKLQKEEVGRVRETRNIEREMIREGVSGKEATKELVHHDNIYNSILKKITEFGVTFGLIAKASSLIFSNIKKTTIDGPIVLFADKVHKAFLKLVYDIYGMFGKLASSKVFNFLELKLASKLHDISTFAERTFPTFIRWGQAFKRTTVILSEWAEKSKTLITIIAASMAKIGIETVRIDNSAQSFRKTLGLSFIASKQLESSAINLASQYGNIGITTDEVFKSMVSLTNSFGFLVNGSDELYANISAMNTQFGVSQNLSTDFLKTISMISGKTVDANKHMLEFAQWMSESGKVPVDVMMGDVAIASRQSYEFLSKNPTTLMKSAILARQLGTSLQDTAKTARSLIHFTSSVEDEMEASVLLGKGLNLQHARELAYRKDLSGLNKEILEKMKEINFNSLDPMTQDAVARAFGKSSYELSAMLEAEKERQKILSDPKLARMDLLHQNNLASMAKISASISQIWTNVASVTLPIVKTVLDGIANTLSFITSLGKGWALTLGLALASVTAIAGIIAAKLTAKVLGGVGEGVGKGLKGVSKGVSSFGGTDVLKGALAIGIVAGGVWILSKAMTNFQGINWKSLAVAAASLVVFTAAAFGLGALLDSGVGTVLFVSGVLGIAALGAALIPFAFAAKKASEAMVNLGNGFRSIVDGLVQIQGLSLAQTIIGVINLTSAIVELVKAINSIPEMKVERINQLQQMGINLNPPAESAQKKADASNQDVVDEIRALRKSLESNGIMASVSIDGQKLDQTMARNRIFKGELNP